MFSPHHRRRSVRLRFHDYAGGLYFVTVCTHSRQPLFGRVVDGVMVLSRLGEIARDEWVRTEAVRATVALDAFVVMPDHVHLLFGIVEDDRLGDGGSDADRLGGDRTANDDRRGTARRAPTAADDDGIRRFAAPVADTVPTIVRSYKSAVTRAVNLASGTPGAPVWQRGYHDRVVRSAPEADAIRRYVAENPARWAHRGGRRDGHRI